MSDELRPQGQSGNEMDLENDPLAELARIVAGEPEPEAAVEYGDVGSEQDAGNASQPAGEQVEPVSQDPMVDLGEDIEAALQAEFDAPASESVAVSVDQVSSQPAESAFADDSFMDDLRSALESDSVPQAEQVSEPVSEVESTAEVEEVASFEDDLISVLETEITGEAEVTIPNSEVSENEVAAAAEAAMDDLQSQLNPNSEAQLQEFEQSFENELSSVFEQEEVTAAPDPVAPDAAASHSMDDDLGAVFANEFEQIMAGDQPAELQGQSFQEPVETALLDEEMTSASPMSAPADDAELDFSKAFAQELGVDNLIETPGWDADDTSAANAAFVKAASSGEPTETVQSNDFGLETQYEPTHSGEIPAVDETAAFSNANDNPVGSKKYAIAALVIALFAGSIAAGYGFLGGGTSSDPGQAQLVKAEGGPFKVKPDDPGGRVAANQDKASYESVEGQSGAGVEQETLVSGTEEPAVVDESQLVEVDEPATNLQPKSDDRLASTEGQGEPSTTPSDLTPRVVQTVTVKPDGTIITNPIPSPATVVEETAATATQVASNTVANIAESIGAPKPVATTVISQPQAIDGARATGDLAVPEASPLPKPAPVAKPKPVQVAAAKPAQPKPAAAPARKSEWVVQVSSQRSAEAAQASYNNLRGRFSVLQGRPMSIQRANVNGSTFYRVRVQTASRGDATQLCNSLQSSGGSCFVTR